MTALERYLAFSKNAWGALANVSLFFPFSVGLSDALRVRAEYQVITAILCAGAVLTAWVARPVYWLRELSGSRIRNLLNIGSGLLGAGISLLFCFALLSINENPDVWAESRPALYLLGFSFLTAGFAMLGLKEYLLTGQDLGFEPSLFRDKVIQMQLVNLAQNYFRCRARDIRVTALTSSSHGIQLRIRVPGDEEYQVRIGERGTLEEYEKT